MKQFHLHLVFTTRPKGLLDPKVEDDLAFFRSRDSLDLINKGASVDVY